MVYGEAGIQTPKLNLTFLCDNRFLSSIISINEIVHIVHMESFVQTDDRQAGSGKTNLPKDQEAGHLHVQLLIRRPGRSNSCRTQQVQRHVFRVWGYLKILRRKKLLTLHSGVERSWSSISGRFKDVPHEHREHVRQPHPHLPQQDDEHLLRDLVRHQDELRVGFCLQMQIHPTPTIQGVWTRWSSTWTTSSWWTSRWRWNRRPRRRSTHPGQLSSPSSLVEW